MSPFVMRFADGSVYFVGLGLVLISVVLLGFVKGRWAVSSSNLVAILGILCVILSANPQPLLAYMVWGIVALSSLVVSQPKTKNRRHRVGFWVLLLLCTLYLGQAEALYHRRPRFSIADETPIVVLGDSISAGTGIPTPCWPEMLAEISGMTVINLAQPGATVADAKHQAARISSPQALVIVEIGGNDLLGETDAATFRKQLHELIRSLRIAGHPVLMMEIPLYPFQNNFGHAQREVAKQEGVVLLPKRFFARVLETPEGTIDGLHLSPKGHRAMAEMFAALFAP